MAVEHYARAARALGLWRSEEIVFRAGLEPREAVLDAACGAGRIAFGLWRLGFADVRGVDFSAPMIDEARTLAAHWGIPVAFEVGDLRSLPWDSATFGSAVVGFNGLMQIPGRTARRAAMQELARVTRTGGRLVFTTHDRGLRNARFAVGSESGSVHAPAGDHTHGVCCEEGDTVFKNPEGWIFMHWPTREEVLDDLTATGWRHREDHLRSEIANETAEVRAFSDECRFWIAERLR